jgi:hypothetical protein
MRVGLFSKLLVVAILLILLSIVLPVAKVENVDAILASATFLYGIFYGFEAAVVLQNFSSLKSLVSAESASILALWNLSQILPKNAAKEIEERIEHYLVLAIENPLTKYVQATNREFFAIFEPLKEEGGDKKPQQKRNPKDTYSVCQSNKSVVPSVADSHGCYE